MFPIIVVNISLNINYKHPKVMKQNGNTPETKGNLSNGKTLKEVVSILPGRFGLAQKVANRLSLKGIDVSPATVRTVVFRNGGNLYVESEILEIVKEYKDDLKTQQARREEVLNA
jgi:hypothetical protein